MNQSIRISDELAEFIIKKENAGPYAPRILEFEQRARTKELLDMADCYPAETLFSHRLIKSPVTLLDMAAAAKEENLFTEILFRLAQKGGLTEKVLLPHLEKALLENNIDRINALLCVDILQNRNLPETVTRKHKILALCLVKRSHPDDKHDECLMDRTLKDHDFTSFCMFEEAFPDKKRSKQQSKQIQEICFDLNRNEKEVLKEAKEKAIAELNAARKKVFNFKIMASRPESKSRPVDQPKHIPVMTKTPSKMETTPCPPPATSAVHRKHIDICA